MKKCINLFLLLLFSLFVILPERMMAQRIRVNGNCFVINGNEIFMNGVNTPWDKWNDFGGDYDPVFWNSEFQRIRVSGGNCCRIWISCDGEKGMLIDTSGHVLGASDQHWNDLDNLFQLAQKNKIYIMATMLSFDHTKDSHTNFYRWRKMINDHANVKSYIENYLSVFVNRYKNNPYLWSIDACNEIEWTNQDADNAKFSWDKLQYLVANMAVCVHQNSKILFTLGSAAIKWNCDLPVPFEANHWSDSNLQKEVPSSLARLDFYSPHFYGWVVRWFGNFCTEKTPSDYGLNDRPCMVGENPATGIFFQLPDGKDSLIVPINEAFIKTYENGWKGLMVWTSNGVDKFGSLKDCGPGLKAFSVKYPKLVKP